MIINSLVLRSEIVRFHVTMEWVLGTNYTDVINKTYIKKKCTNYFLSTQSDQLNNKRKKQIIIIINKKHQIYNIINIFFFIVLHHIHTKAT